MELDVGNQVRRRRPLVVGKHLPQAGGEAHPLGETRAVRGGAAAGAVEQPRPFHVFEQVLHRPARTLMRRPGAQEFRARLVRQDRFDLLRRE